MPWLLAMAVLFSFFHPHAAHAQDEEAPLRLAFVNVADSAGADAYATFEAILQQSSQLTLIPQATFLAGGEDLGITTTILRRGADREANAENIRALMASLEVEGLVVQDVFARGGKLQMVVIGPKGLELDDLRRDIRRGQVSDDQAIGLLRDVFAALVPEVRTHRAEQEEAARQAELARQRELEAAAEDDILSIRDQVLAQRRARVGNLETGYQANVGALMGHRLMRLQREDGFEFNHGTPFFGIGVDLDARLKTFSGDTAVLGAAVFGGYAPFKTGFNVGGEDVLLDSSYMRLGAEAYYLKAFSADFLLRGYLGAETSSVTLAQNDLYTGHRYLSARAGVGVEYIFGEMASLELGGGVLPLLSTANSGGAYGDSEGLLGFEGAARFQITPMKDLNIALDYTFQHFKLDYASPGAGGAASGTTDMIHLIMLSVGYGR